MIILLIVFIQLLFGINYVTSKVTLGQIDSFSFAFIRFLVGGIMLFAFSYISKNNRSMKGFLTHRYFKVSLITMFLGQVLFMLGLPMTSAINASIISISIPVFTYFITILRGQSQFSLLNIFGLFLAIFGVLILKLDDLSGGQVRLLGDFLIILACLSLSINISITKDLFADFPVMRGTSFIFISCAILCFPFCLYYQSIGPLILESPFLPSFIYCILGGTVATYFLSNWVIQFINPFKLSILIYLQPIIASLISIKYLGEEMNFKGVIASVMIFISIVLIYFNDKKVNS